MSRDECICLFKDHYELKKKKKTDKDGDFGLANTL